MELISKEESNFFLFYKIKGILPFLKLVYRCNYIDLFVNGKQCGVVQRNTLIMTTVCNCIRLSIACGMTHATNLIMMI